MRGTVFDGTSVVPDADVTVVGNSRTTWTTEAGEFVYYFEEVASSDVVTADVDGDNEDERVYRPGGSDPEFKVTADGSLGQIKRSVTVEVGRLTTRDLNYQP